MKKLFLSLLLLLPLCIVAQVTEDAAVHEFRNAFSYYPRTLKFEYTVWRAGADPYHGGRTEGNVKAGSVYTTFKITNNDHCAYTLLGLRDPIDISIGENEILSKLIPDGKNSVQFRGIAPNKKFVPDKAIYELPCRSNKDIQLQIKDIPMVKQDVRILTFGKQANDTVYAMRGGFVCLHPSKNKNSILVNHADETFSLYYDIAVFFVKPGDKIVAGQPVGLCHSDIHTAHLYLDKDKLKLKKDQIGFPYKSFVPVLYTESGVKSFSEPGTYSVTFKDAPLDIITQDMSKSEKKKYLKALNTK